MRQSEGVVARDLTRDDWRAALVLPGATVVRGRGVQDTLPGGSAPEYGLYLGVDYAPAWQHGWLDWPDFGVPADPLDAVRSIERLYRYARAGRRVEAACRAGKGRTGTVIACLAILDGLPADHAVSWTRHHFHHRAVQTPWQRAWVRRFPQLREQAARSAR
ncbi:protein-tyrosine phosphatase family protein [Actinomycetospora lemnae]|uniref:Protein-tyrosine phosphatase family protein n=1 Tax=Actinomycetospora lemnae TaxID=3019891 RepID=A0ABT5T5X5_9PSEU|nr:protein-tyrosine phosphatase family protein [Actinomycetospora sp. DW7H6]MDD7969363.1 protein-tyrosine phosphatase family protein [Actinomycetospora sp. DW7H6]